MELIVQIIIPLLAVLEGLDNVLSILSYWQNRPRQKSIPSRIIIIDQSITFIQAAGMDTYARPVKSKTMKTIFNEHLLPLDPGKLDSLITDATQRRRFFSVTYSVMKAEGKEVSIRTTQHKPFSGNVMPVKKMVESTRALFSEYLPGYTIHVDAVPYSPSPPDVVTSEWILKEMNKKKIRLKDIVSITGVDKAALSQIINGKRPLSQVEKALFYLLLTDKK